MSEQKKEKSLIEMAREHMDKAGADPETGVSVPETPASSPKNPSPKPMYDSKEEVKEIKEHFDSKLTDAVDKLLEHVSTSTDWRALQLPSRGKAYVDCDESVMIRPFTFAEEKKLRSIRKATQGAQVINSLIEDCVEGLDLASMTLEDKNYIIFKLREISYGDEYTINATCQECEAENKLVVNISEVPVKYASDDYQEPFRVVLPDSKQEVRFVTPRCKDEAYLENAEKLMDNLWRFALSVGEYSEEKVIKAFFEKTTVRDIVFFREELSKERYGMEKAMSYECAACGEVTRSMIPFTESFFSVS
jgi:rRNA maturation protein Nop10